MQALFHRRCGLAGVLLAFAGWAVGLLMHQLAAFACHTALSATYCQQKVVILSCAGVGLATFFLKTKTREQLLALPFTWPFQARSEVFPRAAAFLY
jgi:hypothetical protein